MDENTLIEIGQRIKEIRRSHGITQEELSEKLDVSPKHISHTECGISCLSLKNLAQLCELFNCSLDYIVFGEKEDKTLSKLPKEIIEILNLGTPYELDILNRYLQFYIELTSKNTR